MALWLKAGCVALCCGCFALAVVEWSRLRPTPAGTIRLPASVLRWSRRRSAVRRDRLLLELARINDLLRIAVASGLNLYQGLLEAAHGESGTIGNEIRLILSRFDLGVGMRSLLEELGERFALPELRRWTKSLILGQALGVPIGGVLARQAEFLHEAVRIERRKHAEVLPMRLTMVGMFFLFPPAVLVVLLPNLLQFLELW